MVEHASTPLAHTIVNVVGQGLKATGIVLYFLPFITHK